MRSHGDFSETEKVTQPETVPTGRQFSLFSAKPHSIRLQLPVWDRAGIQGLKEAMDQPSSLTDASSPDDSRPPSPRPSQAEGLVFTLKFLPKTMSREEVVNKILRFGPVASFNFAEEKSSGKKDQKGCFKRAEFVFATKAAEDIFKGVKRIRIKGLQVKVSMDEGEVETQAHDHTVKPTSRTFSPRGLIHPAEDVRFNGV